MGKEMFLFDSRYQSAVQTAPGNEVRHSIEAEFRKYVGDYAAQKYAKRKKEKEKWDASLEKGRILLTQMSSLKYQLDAGRQALEEEKKSLQNEIDREYRRSQHNSNLFTSILAPALIICKILIIPSALVSLLGLIALIGGNSPFHSLMLAGPVCLALFILFIRMLEHDPWSRRRSAKSAKLSRWSEYTNETLCSYNLQIFKLTEKIKDLPNYLNVEYSIESDDAYQQSVRAFPHLEQAVRNAETTYEEARKFLDEAENNAN